METLVERITNALERQVAQHDEAVARNLAIRDENIQRHERDRAADLAHVRQENAHMIARVDMALVGIAEVKSAYKALDARLAALEEKWGRA